ncbi:hypothetical protein [uncultured Amnibacterium sp.]|uniref:hypothetical protein n=1 Tax=uncultured Amnibacterium sp. TaxID=1631851 RepID=UPI0035CC29BC
MRRLRLAALVAVALLLTGCSEIPMSGPVQNGSTEGPNNTTIVYLPNPPAPGAKPRDIVTGFVTAASAGGDFRVAKEYLASSFVTKWKPSSSVLVQESQSTMKVISSTDITVNVPFTAEVSRSGVYSPTPGSRRLDFHLTQQSGQWRIDSAPDGIVLGETVFQRIFRPQAVEFFDPTWRRLVPDFRWFPVSPKVASGDPKPADVVDALLAGPTGPLAGGVVATALRGATREGIETSSNGVTTVTLSVPGSGPSAQVTGRMQQQLIQSLQLPTASALRLVVNGRVAAPVKLISNQPGSLNAYVVTKGKFGTLASNGGFTEEPTLGKQIVATRPSAVTVSVPQKLAVVRTGSGEIAIVTATGRRVIDSRAGVIAPTLDQRGWAYSVPADQPGALQASDGSGPSIDLDADLGGTKVDAIEASPDGTRMLVLVDTAKGPEAFVAGIQRDSDGTPTGLTTAHYLVDLGGRSGSGVGATWVDDGSVATLIGSSDASSERVRAQQLGGVALPLGQLTNATSIVGTSNLTDLRARISTGDLWTWTSSLTSNLWQSEGAEPVNVSVLAVQR